MLAFDKWWAEKVQRNPALTRGDTKISLTVEQLKANMKKAFDAGWQQRNSEQLLKPKTLLQELADAFENR
jgi:hypothetical protein